MVCDDMAKLKKAVLTFIANTVLSIGSITLTRRRDALREIAVLSSTQKLRRSSLTLKIRLNIKCSYNHLKGTKSATDRYHDSATKTNPLVTTTANINHRRSENIDIDKQNVSATKPQLNYPPPNKNNHCRRQGQTKRNRSTSF